MLKRRAFWVFLFPLACLWAMVARYRRKKAKPYRSKLPVVCVGNLHSGGSGKTPLVLAIVDKFAGSKPTIVSRGYRSRKSPLPRLLDRAAADGPSRYGDEPWMIAQRTSAPIWISPRRKEALQEIERTDCRLVVLDDGFQHLAVAASMNLIVIAAERSPVEDSYCLPLGDLREPWSALRGADAVVLTRGEEQKNENAWREFIAERFSGLPVFVARRVSAPLALPPGSRPGVFCGIAAPERFIDDIARMSHGAAPAFALPFPDHHAYREADIERILAEKKRTGATHLVTTEKDRAKVEALFAARGETLCYARIHHELPEQFWYFLRSRLETT